MKDVADVQEAQEALAAKTFAYLTQEGATLSAVTIVCDSTQMVIVPLRMTMEQATAVMQLACTALQEQVPESKGEMH